MSGPLNDHNQLDFKDRLVNELEDYSCRCDIQEDGTHQDWCVSLIPLCKNYICSPEDCDHICKCHECFCARCHYLMCPHHEEDCELYEEEEVSLEIKSGEVLYMGPNSFVVLPIEDKYKDIKFVYRAPLCDNKSEGVR